MSEPGQMTEFVPSWVGWNRLIQERDEARARLAAVEASLDECDALAERVHAKDPAMGSAYGRIVQLVRVALTATYPPEQHGTTP